MIALNKTGMAGVNTSVSICAQGYSNLVVAAAPSLVTLLTCSRMFAISK
jgi:hypothetical protein